STGAPPLPWVPPFSLEQPRTPASARAARSVLKVGLMVRFLIRSALRKHEPPSRDARAQKQLQLKASAQNTMALAAPAPNEGTVKSVVMRGTLGVPKSHW